MKASREGFCFSQLRRRPTDPSKSPVANNALAASVLYPGVVSMRSVDPDQRGLRVRACGISEYLPRAIEQQVSRARASLHRGTNVLRRSVCRTSDTTNHIKLLFIEFYALLFTHFLLTINCCLCLYMDIILAETIWWISLLYYSATASRSGWVTAKPSQRTIQTALSYVADSVASQSVTICCRQSGKPVRPCQDCESNPKINNLSLC